MSDKKTEDITRIEDLPNVDRTSDEDEDFQDLESLAQDLGIEDSPPPIDETKHNITSLNAISDIDESSEFNSENDEDDYAFSNSEQADTDSDSDDSFNSGYTEEDVRELEQLTSTAISIPSDSFDSNFDTENDHEDIEEDEALFGDDNNNEFSTNDYDSDDFTSSHEVSKLEEKSVDEEKSEETVNAFDTEEIEPIKEKLPEDSTVYKSIDKTDWKEPETFSDVGHFTETVAYGDLSAEGNPPFSIILKNLKYKEDAHSITELLIENKVLKAEQKDDILNNLMRGQLLIPRISEYSAIILAHKLRGFDLEILCGLTEEINPPKSYQSNDKGLSSKRSLLSNKSSYKGSKDKSRPDDFITSTLAQIEGYRIEKIFGIITHSKTFDPKDLKSHVEDQLIDNSEFPNELRKKQLTRQNELAKDSQLIDENEFLSHIEEPSSSNQLNIDNLYQSLINEMSEKIDKPLVNGILGINFTINPIEIDGYLSKGPKYQVICSGNMVCLEKI